MKEWVAFLTEYTIVVINALALVVIAIGTIEMALTGVRALFNPSTTRRELRDGYLRYARSLSASKRGSLG